MQFVGWWALFTAIEVLLVGKVDPQETPAGAAIGALAAAGTLAASRAGAVRYRVRARWMRLLVPIAIGVVRDTIRVFALLLRHLAGGPLPHDRIVDVPFDAGGDDPESNAHRALAIAAVSCAPNSIVLDVRRARGTLRVHYLDGGAEKPRSKEWPL